MKRFTFQTIESEGLFDDYGRSFSKNEIQYGLTRKSRIKTEISLQHSCNIKKSAIIDDVEDDIKKKLTEIQDKIAQLKQKISQSKTTIESWNYKLMKIQEQIEDLELKFKSLARLISEIIKFQNSPNKLEYDQNSKKTKDVRSQIQQQKLVLETSIFEQNQELIQIQKLLNQKKKERQDMKQNLQILIMRKTTQEQELQTLQKLETQKRDNLLDYLYGQCNLQNNKGSSIIDIIRKVKQISHTFDSSKLPNELDNFEKQYILNKVCFENAKKSTITLNESFSQKLKMKHTQSPVKINYLKKIIGQDAYSYIPKLQDNPFKEINRTNSKILAVKAKSLENNKFRKCDVSMQTVLIK